MKLGRFNAIVEIVGVVVLVSALVDEIRHRGAIGWILALVGFWGLYVIFDDRDSVRYELMMRSNAERWWE